MRWEQLWKEISATILDLFSTRRIHTLSHSHKRKFISESHAGGLHSLCSSFIIGTVSIFVQVQTTCRWYSTPANYRADFKDWLIYFTPAAPPPPSTQLPTHNNTTAVMLCPVVFIQPSYSSYLSSPSQLLFSTLILQFLGPDSETKCPTMNKTTALFSVPHGNLITWYEHFIVSKLLFYQSPFLTLKWEVRSLYRVEPKAPLGSINYVCVSAPQPPGGSLGLWLKWFSAQPFCQVKHSEKPVTRKPQCSPRLHLWDLAPHTCSPNLALDGWCD